MPPNSHFAFSVGTSTITITADDWNTIIGTSIVPPLATVVLDPYFKPTATTHQRFQYLADILIRANGPEFDVYGLATGEVSHDEVVTLGAWVNPGRFAVRMTRLTVRVTTAGSVIESTGTFYTSAGHSIVVPARGVYFARLTTPLIKRVGNSTSYRSSFTYRIARCTDARC